MHFLIEDKPLQANRLRQEPHTDRVLEVDDCLAIDQVYGRYVQLVEVDLNADSHTELDQSVWENTYLTI